MLEVQVFDHDRSARVRYAVFVALCATACSSPSQRPTDAAAHDTSIPPDASLCGNQVLDNGEQCDEGLRNGTPHSRCTKQCIAGIYPNNAVRPPTQLTGHHIHDLVDVEMLGNDHLVFRDDDSIFIAVGLNEGTLGVPFNGSLVALRGAAAPTSLGSFEMVIPYSGDPMANQFPLWIEQPSPQTNGAQGLYWAHLDANHQPIIHPVTYPFADGTGGTLLTRPGRPPIIIDQSSTPPYDLLVAVFVTRSEREMVFTTARIPSRGRTRGVVAGHRLMTDLADSQATGSPSLHRILQFYSDTHAFSLIDLRPLPPDDFTAPYTITESASGQWPFDVATAVDWREASVDGPGNTESLYGLTHPSPFAVINTDGSVYTWQFNASFGSQDGSITPFAQVPAGTHVACMFDHAGQVSVLWTLTPDGQEIVLNDGDTALVTSTSLEPKTLPAVSPFTTAALLPTFGDRPSVMAVDDMIYVAFGS